MKNSLGSRLWGVLLTGIPFAVYKMGVGWFACQQGLPLVGYLMIAWGALDVLLNLLSVRFPKSVSYCLLSNIGMRLDKGTGRIRSETILLAVDSFLALLIAAGMIWFGKLPLTPEVMGYMWNIAVVSNLIAVGSQQVWSAARRGNEPTS